MDEQQSRHNKNSPIKLNSINYNGVINTGRAIPMIDTSHNPNCYSGVRWNEDGDGPGGGDDVDDDHDDARRDDDDDDFPLREGSFPGRNLPAGVLFLSVSFPPRDGGRKIIRSRPQKF